MPAAMGGRDPHTLAAHFIASSTLLRWTTHAFSIDKGDAEFALASGVEAQINAVVA